MAPPAAAPQPVPASQADLLAASAPVAAQDYQLGLVAFLDMAYQGFAEGIDADAAAVRAFAAAGGGAVALRWKSMRLPARSTP